MLDIIKLPTPYHGGFQIENSLLHRFWDCPASLFIWKYLQNLLITPEPVSFFAVSGLFAWTPFPAMDLLIYTSIMWTIHTQHYNETLSPESPHPPWEITFTNTINVLFTQTRDESSAASRRNLVWLRLQDLLGRIKPST